MGLNRVFLPQDALDVWMEKGRIDVVGEDMTLKPGGQRFRLKTALRFMEEVTEEGDPAGLVGKVKDIEQVVALGGEHAYDSVILGDAAYTVVEGFVGEPLLDESGADGSGGAGGDVADAMASGTSLADAAAAATGEQTSDGEIDLLARFFLSSS